MRESTETLQIGDRAPDFALQAANREGDFSLREHLQRGPVILEFLRGTW
jgi:peroxiredoxin